MKRIVVLSDLQIPYNDKRATANVLEFVGQFRPEEVASVGDEVDFPQISRWNRGMEGEYAGDLEQHIKAAVSFLEALRAVHSGAIHVSRSNHMDRPLAYVRKYAPGLLGLQSLTVPSLLQFERLGIDYHEEPFELAPHWLLMHGDEGSLIKTPGGTAMGLARRHGKSVIAGHTHKQGVQHDHSVSGGKITRELWGVEVGNLMDMRKAGYLKGGHANWAQGFGILYVDNRKVTPTLIPVKPDGSFVVEGKRYG